MPTPIRLTGILVKEETVYSQDAAPVPANDGVLLAETLFGNITFDHEFENTREGHVSGGLVPLPPNIPVGSHATLNLEVEARGPGVAYSSSTPVRPEIDPLLMSCPLARTHDDSGGSESVTYGIADTGHLSSTIWAYAGAILYKVVGCRGTFDWEIRAGQGLVFSFTLQGMVAAVETDASLPAITYDSVLPPVARAIGLTINAGSPFTPNLATARFSLNANATLLPDANGTDALEGVFHAGPVDPRLTVECRQVPLSTYNPAALALARTAHTIDLTVGDATYNRVGLDENEAYVVKRPNPEDDSGFAGRTIEYMLRQPAIVFT